MTDTMMNDAYLNEALSKAQVILDDIDRIKADNEAAKIAREKLEKNILELGKKIKDDQEELDIVTHAIEILRGVSDETVKDAYKFIEKNLNMALERMFKNSVRKIEIKESIRNNQYPQLNFILHVGNGKVRSLKSDSGHGIAQIVSFLSILCLIVITKSRRIVVMDEVISGVSVRNRMIIAEIMWTFVEIGFQFIVNEHGFIPERSKVYHLEMVGDVSHVKQTYIAKRGIYLQGGSNGEYDYSSKSNELIANNSLEVQEEASGDGYDFGDDDEKDENIGNSGNAASIPGQAAIVNGQQSLVDSGSNSEVEVVSI